MSYSLKSTFATLPKTARGVPIVLGGDPKGKNFLYSNGNSIIIRHIDNPEQADLYTEHSQPTTVAKYSPSGFYIASADITGKVRIWDTTQKEHILKNEFQPIAGPIKDLAWSGDSQKVVVGGEGRERFGHVFSADTGTSVGEIMGQSKSINSVDFRSSRPFRIITASEDNTVAFFHGPPFKFQFTIQDHTRFVNSVRYSPDGELFVSGGADGKCFIFDGKTGEKKAELGNPAHKMGIYGVTFSPDNKQVLTISGDKTAKIWDATDHFLVKEFVLGTQVDDMLVGCLWQGNHILTVSLSGHITYLDQSNPSKPLRIIKGHNKPITALVLSKDKKYAFTASFDGNICRWDVSNGHCDLISGKGHTNQVQDICIDSTHLITCGMDDMVFFTDLNKIPDCGYQSSVKMTSQPKGIAVGPDGTVFVACIKEIAILKDGKLLQSLKADYEPQCVAINVAGTELAVGGGDMDKKVHIFSVSGSCKLEEKKGLEHHGCLKDISYSPDGRYLAACDAFRKIQLYELPEHKVCEWGYHTARVNSINWSPDSKHLASGALDTHCIIWDPSSKTNYTVIKGAHPQSQVTRVEWVDNNTLLSVGQDSCVKQWSIKH
ncbi:hypothetical protein HELRODRAFT_156976 [Helobdella robusta]|uniref:Actin-interacting protein 1 n=1 Tax=Helobdella robusta TaxID=6412 RepID=T1EM43_HELRO|nr:hypothetical protein HELRODRAFT_156976 [Helobdella robusta]ESO04710.1 hypothetical protein HELRODRAFT_156976 [Helobdella robusta]